MNPDIVTAQLRHLRIAPRKMRLVAGLVRGKMLPDALRTLAVVPKRGSRPLLKLLHALEADARIRLQIPAAELAIAQIRVDEGPVLKRMRPRAMGRGATIRKRSSHVSVVLAPRSGYTRIEDAVARKETFSSRDLRSKNKTSAQSRQSRMQESERASSLRNRTRAAGIRKIFSRKVIP